MNVSAHLPRPCVRPLAAALLLCCASSAAAVDNPQVAIGVHLDVPPGSYLASTGAVFRASGSGGSISGRDSVLTATAEGGTGRGVVAFGAGSLVALDNSQIVVTGLFGAGVEALFGGEVRIAGTRIELQKRGTGVIIGANSVGSLTDSSIVMGDAGVAVQSSGQLSLLRTTVSTGQLGGTGITANGALTQVQDSEVITGGSFASAIDTSQNVTVLIGGSTLRTTGDNGSGIAVRSGATVDVSAGTISTAGNDAPGIRALVFTATPITLRLNEVGIQTTGNASPGIQLNGAAHLAMVGGSIDSVSSAVVAGADTATFSGARLASSGAAASALQMSAAGGSFQLTDTQVTATGADSWGAELAGRFEMAGGSLDSAQYGALRSDGAVVSLSAGARVSGGNGHLFDQASAAPTTLSMQGGAQASGDIGVVPGTPVGTFAAATTVALDSGALWTGATQATVTGLSMAGGSRWQITADSDLQALQLDDATLAFSAPAAAGFKTLRVDADLSGNGGLIALHARLGEDGSPGDLLHVRGDTRGQFALQVDNAGGAGGLTVEGIRLVQVDGTSAGRFRLNGRVVAGAYEYLLFQGRPGAADGNWYLRSEWLPPPDPCIADPTGPGCIPPPPDPCVANPGLPQCRPPTPVYRPELAAYLANTSAALELFQYAPRAAAGAEVGRRAWLRVEQQQGRLPREAGQLSSTQRYAVLRAGVDLLVSDDGQAAFGVMAAHGQATAHALSLLSGYTARGRVQGSAAGLYGRWEQNATRPGGAFANAWLQAGRYRNRVSGEAIAAESYATRSWGAALEGGYRWQRALSPTAALRVEPRLQATYTRLRGGDHQEANDTVIGALGQGVWRGEAGVRLAWVDGAGPTRVQPFVALNALRDSRAGTLRLDGVAFSSARPRARGELQLGVELAFASGWSGTGLLALQRGGNGFRQHSGELGLRYQW